MVTIKCNVVGGHLVNDLGLRMEYGEERTFTDEVWQRSKDLKNGVARNFLIKVREWIDRKIGQESPPPVLKKAPGRKIDFAPAYQLPKVVPPAIPAAPVVAKAPAPAPTQIDLEAAISNAVKGLIDSGVLVPANAVEKKLDELLNRPSVVTQVISGQGPVHSDGPAAPQYIPSSLQKSDITEASVKVESATSEDSTNGAADALRLARAGRTPLRRPR